MKLVCKYFNNSIEDLRDMISLEIVVFTIFFGITYVLFFPFSYGDSGAPLGLRITKYLILLFASLLILDRLKATRTQVIAILFCLIYSILSIINSQKEVLTFSSSIALVGMSLILFLAPINQSLKRRFESRFLLYLTFSCFVSIALFLTFPDAIVWRDDLKEGMPSISGLMDSPNRFGFLLLLGLCLTYEFRGWNNFLLGCLFIVAIPLTGSLGSVISAQLVIIFLSLWTVLIDRRNVWNYFKIFCHSALLFFTFYVIFSGSALFDHLFSASPNHQISNSITSRMSVVENFESRNSASLSELIFGWRGRHDVDLFIFNIIQNGGLLALSLFLILIACCVKKLLKSTKLSSITPYLVSMIILLDLIYNNNFWSFPFLLALLFFLKFYVLWEAPDFTSSESTLKAERA